MGRKVLKAAAKVDRKVHLLDRRPGRRVPPLDHKADHRAGRKADHRVAPRAGHKVVLKAALQLAAAHLPVRWACLRAVCLAPSRAARVEVRIPAVAPAVPLPAAEPRARWEARKPAVARVSPELQARQVARVAEARWAAAHKVGALKVQAVSPAAQVPQAMRDPR